MAAVLCCLDQPGARAVDEAQALGLIGDLYDAAVDPARLEALGATVRRFMGVDSGIMFLCERRTGAMRRLVSASDNFDAAALADYAAYYHARNEWFQRAVPHRLPYVARGEELIDTPAFERTEFCTDWCARVGIFHMIGGVQPVRPGVIVGSGVHKARGRGPFTDAEKRRYALVMAHLARALQIADRLGVAEGRSALSLALIHRLAVGVMLLDTDCTLVFANAPAERLVGRSRWFAATRGRLRTVDPAGMPALRRLVADAAATSAGRGLAPGGVTRVRDPVDGALPVLVAPFRAPGLDLGAARPVAALVFADPDARRPADAARIAAAFGLTETEGRIVAALVAGRSLVEYAAAAGVSINTAKTQLATIFDKTGHDRQAALVGAVRASPVLR